MTDWNALVERLRAGEATAGVIGLGYVGLPLALGLVKGGLCVTGFDTDPAKVEALARGESYIAYIPPERVAAAVREGRFGATGNMARLAEPDAILICVPTPLATGREPDLSFVEATARALAAVLRPGQLVVLESTTYPGTTREVLRPILESGGLACGKDFLLAYSPEREDPGNSKYHTGNIPKVVGADDEVARAAACALYARVTGEVVPVSSTAVAEAAKILENTYRAVNIALVNELKLVFDRMGVNVWEVIRAAATKPFGFQAFWPGPGFGGHCIPIDPFYLTWRARQIGVHTRFIELAGEINERMHDYVVERLEAALRERGVPLLGAKVLVLGVAYKADVSDLRESPAIDIMEILAERGALVSYHDPHVPCFGQLRGHDLALESVPLTGEALAGADAALIVTDHSGVDYDLVVQHAPLVVDTRDATREVREGRERIARA